MLPDQALFDGFGECPVEDIVSLGVLIPQVEDAASGACSVACQQHALDHGVRVVIQDGAVLKQPGSPSSALHTTALGVPLASATACHFWSVG